MQNPCTCQWGNCPYHTDGFVLPVRYESDGDYVEYDYPERYRRQTSHPLAGVTGMVGQMTEHITGTVQNVANSLNSQRSEQGPALFAPASRFSPEQMQGRVAQVTDLVGQMTGRITDTVQSTGRVMGRQPSLLGQASEQSPQLLNRGPSSIGDMTGHIAGMVRDSTQQAAQFMNRFTINRDDSIRQKRSINNVNKRDSLSFLESVRHSRQVDSRLKALIEQIRQSFPNQSASDLLSQIGNGQNSEMRGHVEGIMEDLRGGRISEIGQRVTQLLGSSKNQDGTLQETLQRLGMSSEGPNAALGTQIQQWLQRIPLNGAQGESRKKRSVYTANEWYDKQIPVLQVNERPNETIGNFKRLSDSRVELHAPECLRHSPELPSPSIDHDEHKKCNKCGTHLTDDSLCQSCGTTHQSQYFEYVNGEPVSYRPKITEKRSSDSTDPRYVFDRYGHRYLEHNGHLRLMAPESYRDEIVGSPPNYSGLHDILDQNRGIMYDLNRNGPRMIPRPSEYIQDTIRYIHELVRRDTKRTDSENRKSGDTKKKVKSIYQILPVRYDGTNGEMVMKVYSAKDREEEYRGKNQQTSIAEKSKPTVRKFRKNRKEYEILSYDNNNYSKRHE